MQQDIQVLMIVVIGTILLILLAGFIILSLYFYQRSQHRHSKAVDDLKNSFNREILMTQLEIKEHTLNTISREIHDNIGQILSLAKLNLNKAIDGDNVNIEKILSSKELVSKAILDLRTVSKTLNGEFIKVNGLCESVRHELSLIERTGEYQTHFSHSADEPDLDSQKQLVVFRIIQEALSNIIKHAKGSAIRIDIQHGNNTMMVSLEDDGQGFKDVQGQRTGTGLHNMRYRAGLIGAEFTLDSTPGEGTCLKLSLPLNKLP